MHTAVPYYEASIPGANSWCKIRFQASEMLEYTLATLSWSLINLAVESEF